MAEAPGPWIALAQAGLAAQLQGGAAAFNGYEVQCVDSLEALKVRARGRDVTGFLWDDAFGVEAFARFVSENPDRPAVLVARAWDDEKAGRALRSGAQDVFLASELGGEEAARRIRAAVERHAVVAERNEVLERLRKLEQYKTEFINTAAHELNSPLTPIKLQLHLLNTTHSKGLSENQRRALEMVSRNVDRLIKLMADTLDAARLQASRLTVKKQPVDLHRVTLEVTQTHQPAASHRKLELTFDVGGAPILVDADPDRITQVLHNLIGNAIKFTPSPGKVRVSVRKEGDAAVVRVHDTGIGLRPEDFPRLFQPFSQTHEWVEGPRSGTGLGLYISQGIVEQHGGRIWCDSPGPNQGATFAFALPLPKGPAPIGLATVETPGAVRRIKRFWPILYFKCPTCGSRDINMRILRNKYECRACTDEWQ